MEASHIKPGTKYYRQRQNYVIEELNYLYIKNTVHYLRDGFGKEVGINATTFKKLNLSKRLIVEKVIEELTNKLDILKNML